MAPPRKRQKSAAAAVGSDDVLFEGTSLPEFEGGPRVAHGLGAPGAPEAGSWKTASASPPSGGRPRLVADHTHKEPCTKIARSGTCSFLHISLFTHLIVEVSVFIYLFIYLPTVQPVATRYYYCQ